MAKIFKKMKNQNLNEETNNSTDSKTENIEFVETDKKIDIEKMSEENEQTSEKMSENSTEKIVDTDPLVEMTIKYEQINDKYIRLAAEFDNYRKRTLKEKMELTKTAGEDIILNILPVIDNFERAMKAIKIAKEIEPIKEGIDLIYNKFNEFLAQRGVKEIDAIEKELDTDLHDAITKIPAPTENLKGKIVDVVEKGYTLKDKVIRFAKVVVGE